MARPPLVFDPSTVRQVASWIEAGAEVNAIAAALGIHRNSVRRYFGEQIEAARCKRYAAVLEALYAKAVKGNVAAARAYLRRDPERG
jgi:hypothetical protein